MILHLIEKVNRYSIILASGSPRRKEILDKIALKFSIIPSTFEENYKLEDFEDVSAFAIATAQGKALEVRDRLYSSSKGADIIIGCDTCVYQNGKVYGKPKSHLETTQMIRNWSSGTHDVISGVCVLYRAKTGDWKSVTFSETTSVTFDSNIPQELIEAYLKTGDAEDKAGGYGIQGVASCLIHSIAGCYYNVMGLPLNHFCRALSDVTREME